MCGDQIYFQKYKEKIYFFKIESNTLKHWNGIRVTLRNTEMTRPQIIDKQTDPLNIVIKSSCTLEYSIFQTN
jgi:hypothetical protein